MQEQQPHMGVVGTTPTDLQDPNGTRRANITRYVSPSPGPPRKRFAALGVVPVSSNNRTALQLESGATAVFTLRG